MNDRLSAFDLHTHTIHSKDGLMNPKSVFKWMKRRELTGMAITEHKAPSFLRPVVHDGRFLINSCEFMSTDYGEIIGLFVTEPIPKQSFAEIAENIRDQNAIAVLPHPRDLFRRESAVRRHLPESLIVRHIDLVEGINSRCAINLFNTWAKRLAKRLGKPMTAGSDAHSFLELGHAKTWFQDIETVDDVYEALRRGRTQITGHCSFVLWQAPTMIWQRARRLVY
ncbi:MAG: hypothetical protein C4K49_06835 [Candidatus Thorarchaeota archaeon]|nr:MAG: hypothetical protein C4K49_06835 [Candidatus Thorarchaeota archaeon]